MESIIGKHCVLVHDPELTIADVWATRPLGNTPRWHKIMYTASLNDPPKGDWLERMPIDTNWSLRNYELSEQVLTGVDQARSLGRAHADYHAAMVSNAQRRGVASRRLWHEGRNEPQPHEMPYLDDYEIARMERAQELGQAQFGDRAAIQLVLWNLPVGNPGTYDNVPQAACRWDAVLRSRNRALELDPPRAGQTPQFLYGYHAYFGWHGPNDLWGGDDMKLYALPYRHSHCAWPEARWLFTEGGCDEGINDNPKKSWRSIPKNVLLSYGLPDSEDGRAELYAHHLFWLEQLFLRDGRVLGWTLFTHRYDKNEWNEFDTAVPSLNAWITAHQHQQVGTPIWGDDSVSRWQPVIEHRARQRDLDSRVVAAIIKLESGGKVNVYNTSGATGLMLVVDGEHMQGRPTRAVLLNPDQNIKAGCAILKSNLDHFQGNLTKALVAYRAGVGFVEKNGTDNATATSYLDAFVKAWTVLWPGVPAPVANVTSPPPPPSPPTPAAVTVAPKLLWPLAGKDDIVTQEFGQDKRWGTSLVDYSWVKTAMPNGQFLVMAGHNGRDISAPAGTPIVATHPGQCWVYDDPAGYGQVVEVWYLRIGGRAIFKTIYGHMSVQSVAHNQIVEAGAVIGKVGSTGNSTGNHLHFSIKFLQATNPAYRGWSDPIPYMLPK